MLFYDFFPIIIRALLRFYLKDNSCYFFPIIIRALLRFFSCNNSCFTTNHPLIAPYSTPIIILILLEFFCSNICLMLFNLFLMLFFFHDHYPRFCEGLWLLVLPRHFVSDSTPVILWMNERCFVDLAQKMGQWDSWTVIFIPFKNTAFFF